MFLKEFFEKAYYEKSQQTTNVSKMKIYLESKELLLLLPVRLADLDENLDAGLTGSFWFFLTSMPVGLSTGSPFETIWLQVGRSTSSISVNEICNIQGSS